MESGFSLQRRLPVSRVGLRSHDDVALWPYREGDSLAASEIDWLWRSGKALLSSARDHARLSSACDHASDRDPRFAHNALLDPFGRDVTLQELADDFVFLHTAALTESEVDLPRYQDLRKNYSEAFWPNGHVPPVVLFVSHRWRMPNNPDPEGHTADALRFFLRKVGVIATAASSPPQDRSKLVPSLLVHGIMQAALFLGNGRAFGLADRRPREWPDPNKTQDPNITLNPNPSGVADAILGDIGIFYDFSCIPQGVSAFRQPPEDETRRIVERALRGMHLLASASTVLVVRAPADGYSSRAWCAAELAMDQPGLRHIVLRTDMLGEPTTDIQIVGEDAPRFNRLAAQSRSRIRDLDDHWRSAPSGWGVLRALATMVLWGSHELEADRLVPLFVTPDAPKVFPGSEELLGSMIEHLSRLSQADRMLNGALVADVAELVIDSLERAGLYCSVPEDRVYLGLQMLYARHVRAPKFAQFYSECLQRYVEERTTRLLHYREDRDVSAMQAWWVFADEPIDSAAWHIPRWARGPHREGIFMN